MFGFVELVQVEQAIIIVAKVYLIIKASKIIIIVVIIKLVAKTGSMDLESIKAKLDFKFNIARALVKVRILVIDNNITSSSHC